MQKAEFEQATGGAGSNWFQLLAHAREFKYLVARQVPVGAVPLVFTALATRSKANMKGGEGHVEVGDSCAVTARTVDGGCVNQRPQRNRTFEPRPGRDDSRHLTDTFQKPNPAYGGQLPKDYRRLPISSPAVFT